MITIKSAAEIERLDAAGRVVEETLRLMATLVQPGVTTLELDREAEAFIRKQGATPSFLGYSGYPNSICASVNEAVVHGIPSKYRLKDGDIISVDVGAYLNGFHGDAARTFLVGNVSEEVRRLVTVTRECFYEGLRFAKPGCRIGDVASAVQTHAEAHGYGVVREMVGHGIGREMHEAPDVPNYGVAGRGIRLQAGMAICIEPMINLGSRRVSFGSDGWLCYATDRKPSAHYENTVIITEEGPYLTTLHGEEIQ